MSRRGRSRGLPSWYSKTGRLVREDIGGFWYGERSGKLFKRDGKIVDRKMNDTVTDKEREEDIQRRLR